MKKNYLMLSLVLGITWTAAFANNDPKLNSRVLESFKKEFPGAQYVKWNDDKDFLKATFVLADYRAEAWFDANGELLGTIRDLLYDQLPLTVMRGVERRFPDASPLEIREITNSNGTLYKLVIESKKRKYNVDATPDGLISVTKKTKK
ncbi:MAG TPA: hypothetical protein VET23_04205 [Chitinophagaceae bacterium]|nr:hypothetical protein [Chitinophagaceae bacterium]